MCCACSYQRTSALAWGNWKSWTKCVTSVKQPSWKPVSKIWNLLHDINLHILIVIVLLEKCFCWNGFYWVLILLLDILLTVLFKGDAVRGWKIPDGSWKIWFSFKSMATADFEWILLLQSTCNIFIYIYIYAIIAISLRDMSQVSKQKINKWSIKNTKLYINVTIHILLARAGMIVPTFLSMSLILIILEILYGNWVFIEISTIS